MEKLKIGITQGDYNGVGYETLLKVLSDSRMAEICTPIIYGSAKLAAFYRKACDIPEVKLVQIPDASAATTDKFHIINVTAEDIVPSPGEKSPKAGEEAVKALRAAVEDLKEGKIDALVTAPFNKETVQSEDFHFPGHTEYLESELGPGKAQMIMCKDNLRVALVTIHDPLSNVAAKITRQNVLDSIKSLHKSLIEDFGIHAPRIAVLGLNPHAGDGGILGTEEKEIIVPAIEDAKREKIMAFGPYPADGFFGAGTYDKFDGILAMYHDQGLTPFKLLAQDEGVNFTAGLSGVRTSPAHGTAMDIAGKGIADENSMRQAIYTAIDIVANRRRQAQATANPLPPRPAEPRRSKTE